jgi:uncharacterized protein YgbK (DUF1537 family)
VSAPDKDAEKAGLGLGVLALCLLSLLARLASCLPDKDPAMPPTRHPLARILPPVPALVLAALVVLVGCASTPDRLQLAIALNNATVAALDAAKAAHEAKLTADYLRRSGACPPESGEARRACVLQAGREALAALAPEETRLLDLQLAQRAAAAALEEAKKCRDEKKACESSALTSAEKPLERVLTDIHSIDGGAP